MPFHDTDVSFDQDRTTNDLIIKNHQHIPDSFVAGLKAQKMDSLRQRSGDMMLALSVPVSVIEEMKTKYNFDAMEASVAEVSKMLQRMQLDAFIVTNKRL